MHFLPEKTKPTLFLSHNPFSRYSRVSLYSHPHFPKQRLKRLSEWRFWGRGVTRTGPGRELSYQVQPILCASAVQRQWIVKSVQYCAKFTLDKTINVLLNGCYYTAVFKESNTTVSKISNHLYKLLLLELSLIIFCIRIIFYFKYFILVLFLLHFRT